MTTASEKSYKRYACTSCGASGVKLWRMLASSCVELTCMECSLKEADETKVGKHTDQIGGRGPAIPDPLPRLLDFDFYEMPAYWGYTSVPDWGVNWWHNLPPDLPMGHPAKHRKLETREETEARKAKERQDVTEYQEKMIKDTFCVMRMDAFDFWKNWHHIVPLKQHMMGYGQTIAEIYGKPVHVNIFWYTVNEDKLVAFVEETSNLVDHKLIDTWLRDTFKHVNPRHFWSPGYSAEYDCMEACVPGYQKSIRYKLVHQVRDEAEKKLNLLQAPNKITPLDIEGQAY